MPFDYSITEIKHEFILEPVLVDNEFFRMKMDGRRKLKPIFIEFKVNGGLVSGYFYLRAVETTLNGDTRRMAL